MMRPRIDHPRPTVKLRQLEPRLLFSAVPILVPEIGSPVSDGSTDADLNLETTFGSVEPLSASDRAYDESAIDPLEQPGDGVDSTDPFDSVDATDSLASPREVNEVLIIDAAVQDYDALVEDWIGDNPSRASQTLLIDPQSDPWQQITDFLSSQRNLTAIHLITHGDDASIRLGDQVITSENVNDYASSFSAWGQSLAEGGDVLLYGCDVASTAEGRALADALATYTGGDVAASSDLTGNRELGGDWDLEYTTGPVETWIAISQSQQRHYAHVLGNAVPAVTVALGGSVQPGSNATINLTFDNNGLPGDTGFGPFLDVLIPTLGSDGIYDGDLTGDGSLYDLSDTSPADGQPDGQPDGLLLPSGMTVTYQGIQLATSLFTFGDDDGAGPGTTGTIVHPLAVDSSGNPLNVVGQAGDQLLVIELPFGSFADDQPAVQLSVNTQISPLADFGNPLTVFARAGFRYGNDALDNPTSDPTLLSDVGSSVSSWNQSASISPSNLVVNLSTSSNGEGVTGPNWLQTYSLGIDIPTGNQLSNLVITDALPDNIQFHQITSVSVTGAANASVNWTTNVNDTDGIGNAFGQPEIAAGAGIAYDPSLAVTYGAVDATGPQTGSTLVVVADSPITGYDGTDVVLTFDYFLPDRDASGGWIVGGDQIDSPRGEDDPLSPEVTNTVIASGTMAAADPRDSGGPVTGSDTATLDAHSIAMQKGVSVVGGGSPAPGKLLQWTLSFQLSDYYTFGDLVIDDLFSDGQIYFSDAVNNASFSITDRGVTRSGAFATTFGSVTNPFDGINTLVIDQSRRDVSDGGPGDPTAGEAIGPTSDGQTAMKFYLSEALKLIGDDGILEGDYADDGTFDGQPASGTITFFTQIQEDFVDPSPGEDRSVDQGDVLSNTATIEAANHVNRASDPLMPPSGHTEYDDAFASIAIPVGGLTKQLYAINGNTTIPTNVQVSPNDRVTYRLTYDLPTTDFENLVITDFFPLPVFHVDDPDGDGIVPVDPNTAWRFDADTTADLMGPGIVELLATDTFYDLWDASDDATLNDSISPSLTVDSSSNSLRLDFGTYDGTTNSASQLDLLVTVTVIDTVFADGLFLTNMAVASEASTSGAPASQIDLTTVAMAAPELQIRKGIVSTSADSNATYSTASVANELQEISGTAGASFTLTFEGETTSAISSTATTDQVRNALEALSNIDPGDVIVSGGPIGSSTTRIAFLGQYASTDVTLTVSDPGLTTTELVAGGSAITAGSDATRWGLPGGTANTSLIDAATLAAIPLDADVTGLDGRDQVKFAVTVRNVGGADAFDITLDDLLPAGMEVASGGLNLQIYDTAGNALSYTPLGPNPLTDGFRINDPIVALTWADDGFDRLVRMDSRDNFDVTNNAAFVGAPPTGVTSIEAMSLDPTTGFVYAVDNAHLGTVDSTTGAFTRIGPRIDADIGAIIDDVDSLAFDPISGILYGVDAVGGELVQIDPTTGKAIVGAFGGNDTLVVSGTVLDDIAIDFSGTIYASSGNQLETLSIDRTTWTVSRTVIGNFAFGAINLTDMEGLSVDHNGKLWGTTGADDASIYDNRIWEIDKATGVATNPRALTVGGDFESLVMFDPNASGAAIDAGNTRDALIVTYDAQLSDTATAATVYQNQASLIAYSGVDGGSNFVASAATESAQITSADVTLDTWIESSSEPHTGIDSNGRTLATIGEIVRYRVQVAIPEGTFNDVTFGEQLPSGLTFLNDGSATIALISDNNALVATDITDPSANVAGNETTVSSISPTGTFGNEDIADSLNGLGDVYGSGSDVFFRLGTVTNTDNDLNTEYVVLEFNALVDNSASNDAGDVRDHRSQWYVADSVELTSSLNNDDRVVIVEPDLSVDSRTFSMSAVDAGDVVTVNVTISADAGSNDTDAFDLNYVESLPAGFTRTGAVTVTGGSYTPTVTDNSTAGQVDLIISDLPAGETVTVSYQVVASDTLPPNGSHAFSADLQWTSLPGNTGTSGPSDPTGSDPPGLPADPLGERTADDSVYAQNDYRLTNSTNLAGRPIVMSKSLVATEFVNDIDGDAVDDQAVIGEKLTYRIVLDVPESQADNVVIVDTLDSGLAFVGLTNVTATDITHTGGAPITATSITTTVGGSGQTVTFDLGSVQDATPTTVNQSDSITIEYEAIVLNVASNQGGPSESNTTLNNSATLTYTGGSTTQSAFNVEVIEPALTTSLNVYGSGGAGDTIIEAGEAITAEYVLSNASGVDAYDVDTYLDLIRLLDGSTAIQNSVTPGTAPAFTVVDTAGIYNATHFQWVDPDNPSLAGSDTQGWRLQVIDPTTFDLSGSDPSRTITFTVTGTAVNGVGAGGTYATDASATFSSLDGDITDRSTYHTASDERVFDSTGSNPYDDYQSSATSNLTVQHPSVIKSLVTTEINAAGNDHTQATIGELLTYSIQVTLPQGNTSNLVLTDQLDSGLTFDQILSGPNPTTISPDGRTLTWNLGNQFNDPAITTDDSISVTYQAVVLNASANINGTLIGESSADAAFVNYDLPDASAGTPQSDDTSDQVVTLVEPTVTLVRDAYTNNTVGSTVGDAGDPVTYVITLSNSSGVDAYDLNLVDVMPLLSGTTASAIISPAFTVVDSIGVYSDSDFEMIGSDATGWTFQKRGVTDLDLIADPTRTLTIEIQGQLAETVPSGATLSDAATVTWTSLDGDYSTPRSTYDATSFERDGSDTESGDPNDFERMRNASINIAAINPTKVVQSTSLTSSGSGQHDAGNTDLAIGETIVFALDYTFSEGLSRSVRLTDIAGTATKLELLGVTVSSVGTNLYDAGADLQNSGDDTPLTIAAVQSSVVISDTDGDTFGDNVTINLGDIQNAPDGIADANDVVSIIVTARAVDHTANVDGAVLTNKAQLIVADPDTGFSSDRILESSTVDADVIVHDFTLSKDILEAKADAGEQVTVQLSVQNTGTADAFQVIIRDTLDSATYDLSSVVLGSTGVDYPSGFAAAIDTGTGDLTYSGGTIASGDTAVFTFRVDVADTVLPGTNHSNLATIVDSSSLTVSHPDPSTARRIGDSDSVDNSGLDDMDVLTIRQNSIAGSVYHDADLSGDFGIGDSGIAGVTLTLTGTDHLGNVITPISITTADGTGIDPLGSYLFDRLRPGTYTLTETQPTAYLDHEETAGAAATIAGTAPVHDVITFVLPTGMETDSQSNDFGEITKGQISGYVHHDVNLDGNFDIGDGLSNVTVTIDYTDDRTASGSQILVTDANGRFVLGDLRPGNYTITVDSADPQLVGYLDGIERDAHNGVDSGTDYVIGPFALGQGEIEDDKWFGFQQPTSISGSIYLDADNDGVFDASESGISGAQVQLTGTTFEGGTVPAQTTVTDGAGFYQFTGLLPGTYDIVQVAQPTGYLDGIDTAGDPAANTTINDQIRNIVLSDGEASGGNLFGELVSATVMGTVFNDLDGDGVADAGEPGIPSVTVTLSGTEQLPSGGTASITPININTASNGSYAFPGLRPGTYTVSQTQPAAYVDGAETVGTLGGNAAVNDVISNIVLASGGIGTGYDFAETGMTISGAVFRDDNRDGVRDAGEPGISGILVQLYQSDGITWIADDTTDINGDYDFADLPADDYVIIQSQPIGYSSSPLTDPNQRSVTLVTGIDQPNVDFGEALWDLDGRIWFDTDNAGDNDPTEPGYDAVTITLLYAGPDGDLATAADNVIQVTTTDANGDYQFTELLNGLYRVTINTTDLPDGVFNSFDPDGGVPDQSELTIADGDITNHRFAYIGAGSIGDRVWMDGNGNGIQDTGEPPLAGITMTLLFAGDDGVLGNSDDLSWAATTDASGDYTFNNLPDGIFRLTPNTADLPSGMIPSFDVDGVHDGIANITLSGASTRDDVDFGFRGTYTVAGQTWLDRNANNVVAEPNEPGLGGATVQLTYAGPDGDPNTTNDNYVTTTIADANGNYSFENLPDGDFQVTVTSGLPIGVVPTSGSGLPANGIVSFSISGSNPVDQNLGYVGSTTAGGFVWLDEDGNGRNNADTQLSDIRVTLVYAGIDGVVNGDTEEFTLTVDSQDATGTLGQYLIDALPAGTFAVSVDTMDPDLPADVTPFSSPDSINTTTTLTLMVGENRTDIDFGFRKFPEYAYDSQHTFLQPTGFESNSVWWSRTIAEMPRTILPLPVDPIYSGIAEPGTTLLLQIYDDQGQQIGSRTVVSDAGGNWVAGFPGIVIWEHPHSMSVETVSTTHTLGDDSHYNTRRYYQPALHPSMFFTGRPTVQSAIGESPSRVLTAIHQANLRPLHLHSDGLTYDLSVTSNSTAAR